MPKINRIRIINFSYNNDTREIPDETFRFYDGENALLNLSNGGGKTVLIQLFMQPILPDLKLQKRKMTDYFRRNSAPAYVLIEWLLDNPSVKDYLMMGIAIAPGNSANMEESNKIHYFTFASHYQRACEFDLQAVPFVRMDGERQVLLSFERARESVKKVVGSHREMFYFGREDVGEYRKLLGQFGISQEEWKNIIARMNNDEGGITQLFDKCGTSDSVLNEWIIKNIEKSQLAGQTEDTGIQELLAGLVSDTIKNQEYIRAQKIIQEYLGEQKALETDMDELCRALDTRTQIQNKLNGMYQALGIRARNAGADREEVNFRQEELFAELRHIDQEEASETYRQFQEDFLEALEQVRILQAEGESLREQLARCRREKNCQEGAGIMEEIRRLRGKISALKQEMEREQGDKSLEKRLKDLAYSLKLQSKQRQRALETEAKDLQKEIDELSALCGELREKEDADKAKWGNLKVKAGALRSRVQQFEKEQERVFERLGFALTRNVLEQLDTQETEKYKKLLEKNVKESGKKFCQCTEQEAGIREQRKELAQKVTEQSRSLYDLEQELAEVRREQSVFLDGKAQCEAYLDKYGVEKPLLYEPEALRRIFEEKMDLQKAWTYQARSEHRQIGDMISGIRNHCVYLPETLLAAVQEQDISFQTGEAYLQNLPEENRKQQLLRNPMLPFGLILEKKDLGKLDHISFGECYLRQIIPVFTYEQLGNELVQEKQRVILGEQAEFIAVYEEQIFSDVQREEYLQRLEMQREDLEKLMKNRGEEEQQLYQAKIRLESFHYKKGTKEEFEKQILQGKQKLAKMTTEKERLDIKATSLEEEQERLAEMLPKFREMLADAKEKAECYEKFLEADVQYQIDFKAYTVTMEELQKLDKSAVECKRQLEACREKENQLREQCIRMENLCRRAKETVAVYAEAEEAEVLDEAFEKMEQEYRTLTEEREKNQAALQREMEEARRELGRQEEKTEELEVSREEYEQLAYRPERERELKKDIRELEAKKEESDKNYRETGIRAAKIETDRNHAKSRLKELGLEQPLDDAEICQDYERRRKNLRFESDKLRERAEELKRLREDCESLQKRIRDVVPAAAGTDVHLKLEEDMEKQFLDMKEEYRQARRSAEQKKRNCSKRYLDIRDRYRGKNQCVEDILESLSSMPLEDVDLSYDTIYFYLEEFMLKRENLERLLDYYSTQLETISRTRNQIVDQCVSYGTGIYEEIKAIVSKSRIRLSQKSRPVQMLKIDVPRELDNKVRERMDEYINRCLEIMVSLNKKEDASGNEKKIREKLSVLTSGRELLNQVTGTNKIPVFVYKIDLNEKNSGLKRWEDAMDQNSGGEKFVVFFTLVSTLISYVREVTRRNAGGDAMLESKVLIMDNPFAKTSSEHLLKAVMDIAKTFKIQLICLSDLSQSSITNRFSLFYQLSIRKRMYSQKEVVKTGPVQINQPGISENERLEHMELYETGKQGELWELMGEL